MNDFEKKIQERVSQLVDSVMTVDTAAEDFIVIFPGRFQPYHKSHHATYTHLVNKFGKDKVYIATSNKTDAMKSPFSFNEKKKIMTKMFGIPANRIIQVKNTYSPKEISSKFDPKKTAIITVVGEKDATRLSGKYFKPYVKGQPMRGYLDNGYVYASPAGASDTSGTEVRNTLRAGTEAQKIAILKKLYPKVDKSIFDLLIKGIAEQITEDDIRYFLETRDIGEIISESSTASSAGAVQSVDDGPRYHFPSHGIYQRVAARRAAKIGYTVMDYVIRGADVDTAGMAPDYPDGPVDAVSYFPAGVAGEKTATNQIDIVGSAAWNKWFDHATRAASLVGYELLRTKEERIRLAKEKKQSVAQSKGGNDSKFNTNTMSEDVAFMIQTAINEFNSSEPVLEVTYEIDDSDKTIIEHLIDFTLSELNIKKPPTIRLTTDREDISTTAYYNIQTYEIKVYTKNRALADILRSIVHEIVHHQQNLEGRLVRDIETEWAIGETDPWETEAHAMAGHIITKFKNISEKNIYLNEMSQKQLNQVEKFADKVLNPVDVEFTKHFFDRLQDPRNGKEINQAELVGFFRRLSKNKKELESFLSKYKEFVAVDDKTKINIPFIQSVNKIIAKTVMRKQGFASSDAKLTMNEDLLLEGGAYVNESTGEVKCAECGQWMKQIQYRHLKYKHSMSMNDYRIKYPQLPLLAESKKNTGNKNPMANLDVKLKHSNIMSSDSYKNNHSKIMKGKNIGNKRPDVIIKNKTKAFRQKISKAVTESYVNNPELRKIRANTVGKATYTDEYREQMYASGKWIRPEDKDAFTLYQENVRMLTNETYKKLFDRIPDAKKRSRKWHLDHKYSIYSGFINGIPEQILAHYKNLEIKHHSLNESKHTNNSITIDELIRDIQNSNMPVDSRILLTCGGAYGHMAHPFEDMNLTFGDLKILITNALQGNLEMTSEKTDGMNIMISWKNGKLIFARNRSHLKNFGENALDVNGIKAMFDGRGTVGDAFATAADDLSKAIGKLSSKERDSIFNEGHNFMSLEVIYVKNLNTVPYDSNMLIFHGSFEYDSTGTPIGQSSESGSKLNDMIKKVNQSVQKTYNISGPPIVDLPKSKDFSTLQGKYLNKLKSLQSKFKLKDSDTVAMYHQSWWENFIESEVKKKKLRLTNNVKMGLVKRWAFGDKSFRLTSTFISDPKLLDWAHSYDKNNHQAQFKKNILPFELLFLELGADVLTNFKSALIINQDKAMMKIKSELASAARELRKTQDINKLVKFKEALEKLRAIGGMKAVVPTEGIVFQYKGNIYKLTGSFANTHRIISLLKF